MLSVDEDTLSEMMLGYLKAEKQERDKSRFAKLLQENLDHPTLQ